MHVTMFRVTLPVQDGRQFFAGSIEHIKERKNSDSMWQAFVRVAGEGDFTLNVDTSVLHQV